MAAGKGTRMKSERPKVLHPLMGTPLVAYPVRLALALKANPIVVVVGHEAERVEAEVRALFPDAPLRFALQKNQQGTGDAVRAALPALRGFRGAVMILSGDVPLLSAATMRAALKPVRSGRCALNVVTMRPSDPTGYGRVVRTKDGAVTSIVEHKDASPEQRAIDEVNAGIYSFDAEALRRGLKGLSNDNAQGEYYLTDLVADAHRRKLGVETTVASSAAEVQGVNDRSQLAELAGVLRRQLLLDHMKAGVSILDPDTTHIDQSVRIDPDVTLEANVHLRGSSRIGRGSRVGVGSVIENAVIGQNVRIHPYCVISDARVGDGAEAGPFARLRPGARLDEGSKVGNFVELKNTRLGPGAKANHLAYLGDCQVGAQSNVGAGTITCNYDGGLKHPTKLGAGVFVGSNSTLVAPVTLSAGSYIAAGSTVTENVPKDGLALGRARQTNKPGRAATLRARIAKEKAERKKSGAGKQTPARRKSKAKGRA